MSTTDPQPGPSEAPEVRRPVHVLLVEDSEDDATLLLYELRRQGFEPRGTRVDTGPALQQALADGGWDVVISDHNMPGFSGDEALKLVKDHAPDLPFIVVSGTRGEDQAVEVMREGASDFIVKSRLFRLAPVVDRALGDAARLREQRRTAEALAASREQLRQSQRLESIGRLAGGVAHDFNNLMASILTYADCALRTLPSGAPVREDIEEIRRAGRRAAVLTRDLLAFSRQQVLERAELDLRQVVRDVRRLLKGVVGPLIAIDVHHESHDLWSVRADRTQLEQVLMNLAANARDAMPDGGTLTIETSNVALPSPDAGLQPAGPGDYVRLVVRDTGTGIAADVLEKVFEPFFSTKGEGGTGLGLAMVHGVVEQCGGHVFVESEGGTGASFIMYFPRWQEATAPVDA